MRCALSEGMGASSEASVGLVDAAAVRRVGKGRLLGGFAALVRTDRCCTADLLVYIGEIDRRKLYLEHAYPSMFAFCTKRFRMSEAVAAKRIRAGRAAHDPTQVERAFDFDRLGRLVAAVAAL